MSNYEKFKPFSINKSAPIPFYFQVKNRLLEMIAHGELLPGEMIPTEQQLCDIYQVSRSTIRQAFLELTESSVFYRVKGRGTFVAQTKVHHTFARDKAHFLNNVYMDGFIPSNQVLEMKTIIPPLEITDALKLPPNTPVIYVGRLRYANDEPLFTSQTYLPDTLCNFVLTHNLNKETLSDVLAKTPQTKLHKSTFTLESVLATTKDCEQLKITKIVAITLVHAISYNKFDVPVEYTISRYRGDKNTFDVQQRHE